MARSRIEASRGCLAAMLLGVVLLGAVLLSGCGGGAAADPVQLEPVPSEGVVPGSGELTPEGHRETDTDLDTWVAPEIAGGGWYAFPLPSGFQAVTPPEGTELLVRSIGGQAHTVLSVTRLPQEGRLSLELAAAAVDSAGRQPVGDAEWRTVAGVPAVAIDARDTRAEPVMTVRQLLLDIGPDRLVLTVATDADPAEVELGLVEAVVLDNLQSEVLD